MIEFKNKSRAEGILENMLGASNTLKPPQSRVEALLLALMEKIDEMSQASGTVFRLLGEKNSVDDLPTSGNTVGDIWFVKEKSAGYIWFEREDYPGGYWEELGETTDLSALSDLFFKVDMELTSFSDVRSSIISGKIPILCVRTKTNIRFAYVVFYDDAVGAEFICFDNLPNSATIYLMSPNGVWTNSLLNLSIPNTLIDEQDRVEEIAFLGASSGRVKSDYTYDQLARLVSCQKKYRYVLSGADQDTESNMEYWSGINEIPLTFLSNTSNYIAFSGIVRGYEYVVYIYANAELSTWVHYEPVTSVDGQAGMVLLDNRYIGLNDSAALENSLMDSDAAAIPIMLVNENAYVDITPVFLRRLLLSGRKVLFGTVVFDETDGLVPDGRVFEIDSQDPGTGQINLHCIKDGILYQITMNYSTNTNYEGTLTETNLAQNPFLSTTLTIAVSDWVNGSCTKSVPGMTADALVFVKYSDTETEFTETQGANSMTFTASTTPSEAVTVEVAWFKEAMST